MGYKVDYTVGEKFNQKTFKKEVTREKVETIIKKKEAKGKKKSQKIGKILGKPKVKIIQGLDAVKAIAKGIPNDAALVSKGKEGFMDREMMKERSDFLGEYSLWNT